MAWGGVRRRRSRERLWWLTDATRKTAAAVTNAVTFATTRGGGPYADHCSREGWLDRGARRRRERVGRRTERRDRLRGND